jgi:hypothetical protein
MVMIQDIIATGIFNALLRFSSNLADPTFYIYLDGNLIAITKETEYTLAVNLDENSIIEVLDDPDQMPMAVYPARIRLLWFYSEGTNYYKVEEYIDDVWVARNNIRDNEGYMQFESRFLEDGTIHQFRIIPIGINGNEGTLREIAILCCRHPNVPNVDYTYEKKIVEIGVDITAIDSVMPPFTFAATGKITITQK